MREIKFRAWDKQHKIMLSVNMLDIGDYWINCTPSGFPDRLHFAARHDYKGNFDKNRFILMQHTGLKDRNGKEIYEGDIVKAYVDYGPAGEAKITQRVIMGCFGTNLQQWTFKEKGYLPEVIGNIYKNPELLK